MTKYEDMSVEQLRVLCANEILNGSDEDELVYNCPEDIDPDEDQDMALNHEMPAALLPEVH